MFSFPVRDAISMESYVAAASSLSRKWKNTKALQASLIKNKEFVTFFLQVTYWPGTHLPDPVALQLWLSDWVFPGSQLLPGPVHSVCWVADALVSNDGAIVVTNTAAIASIRTNVVLFDMVFH